MNGATLDIDLLQRSIDEQIERKQRPEGFPDLPDVPTSRYVDPGFAAAEHEHMWKKAWLLAGLQSDLPEPGSYALFERLDMSVILSRGKNGVLRAFHNICRHRGSALLTAPKGKVMRFVCPYHSWGYELDGNLASVPLAHDFPCLNKSETGLIPVRCETWRGMVFVNLDPNAGSLADYMQSTDANAEGFPLETVVEKARVIYQMECNWKLAFHNFLEIYHVNSVHPKSLAPHFSTPSFLISLYDKGHGRFVIRKLKGESIFTNDESVDTSGVETFMPAGVSDVFKQFMISLPIFPNAFFVMDPTGFNILTFWPVGTGKTIMDVRLVGWENPPAHSDFWISMTKRLETILTEDKFLFASLQKSMDSGFLNKIKMGYQERALYWLEEEIDRRIGAKNIPADMRVAPVLGG